VSSTVALIYFIFGLRLLLRSGAQIDVESIAEAISERPVEQ
jgi:hypothetical protein